MDTKDGRLKAAGTVLGYLSSDKVELSAQGAVFLFDPVRRDEYAKEWGLALGRFIRQEKKN